MSARNELNQQIVACQKCPRLILHCQKVARDKRKAYAEQDYWGKPVPNFGNLRVPLLIVGLAPGAHGANRTGRMSRVTAAVIGCTERCSRQVFAISRNRIPWTMG